MATCCGPQKGPGIVSPPCPRCGDAGREVARETVGALATLAVPAAALAQQTYRYCATPACPVVYYGADGLLLTRQDVRVPVSAKDAGLDVPLCYCFGHTRRSIAAEIAGTGLSTASATITREIKAGHCACEVRNPSGRCCLGDVRAYEKHVARCRAAAVPAATTGDV
jgi:hypothetical protein